MITAKKDGESLTISEQTLRFVQESLKTSGHYRGDVDGQWSSSLSSSISKYQDEQNLPKTGLPDIDVVIRIKYVTQNKKWNKLYVRN
ncbi:MAG: peptidoglycan-binding protein [Polymorphobacter sp.]|uniref:peptidoglycan-binding protein n=1 Tax=Polymorphobacter sp. TaxID=1909290 RepID=UPI003A89110D